MKDAVIVSAARTPVGKAKRGGLATVRPDEMAASVIQELLKRTPNLDPAQIEDVVIGCAFPEGEQGLNMARMISLRAGLPDSVPAETINRYCASGVQSIAHVAYAIQSGQIETGIAGGAESMTMIPMTGFKFAPNPYFAQDLPHYYTNMGLTAENVSEKYGISRADQDEFSLKSHQKAAQAVNSGRFDPELVSIEVEITELNGSEKPLTKKFTVNRDEGPRLDTNRDALSRLKPAFKEDGVVTAGIGPVQSTLVLSMDHFLLSSGVAGRSALRRRPAFMPATCASVNAAMSSAVGCQRWNIRPRSPRSPRSPGPFSCCARVIEVPATTSAAAAATTCLRMGIS